MTRVRVKDVSPRTQCSLLFWQLFWHVLFSKIIILFSTLLLLWELKLQNSSQRVGHSTTLEKAALGLAGSMQGGWGGLGPGNLLQHSIWPATTACTNC